MRPADNDLVLNELGGSAVAGAFTCADRPGELGILFDNGMVLCVPSRGAVLLSTTEADALLDQLRRASVRQAATLRSIGMADAPVQSVRQAAQAARHAREAPAATEGSRRRKVEKVLGAEGGDDLDERLDFLRDTVPVSEAEASRRQARAERIASETPDV